jgi:hypothetical protein
MNPASADLTGDNKIYRGDDWQYGGIPLGAFAGGILHVKDNTGSLVNLTSWALKAQIRTGPGAANPVDIVCTKTNQSTDPGGFTLTLTATTTAAMQPTTSSTWDLQLTDPAGKVSTYMKGSVTVEADITQ